MPGTKRDAAQTIGRTKIRACNRDFVSGFSFVRGQFVDSGCFAEAGFALGLPSRPFEISVYRF